MKKHIYNVASFQLTTMHVMEMYLRIYLYAMIQNASSQQEGIGERRGKLERNAIPHVQKHVYII